MLLDSKIIHDLDQSDAIASFKTEFHIQNNDLIYLDGNSLGRLPKKTISNINDFLIEEWGTKLVNGWEGWITEAQVSGDLLGEHVLGAKKGEVLVCDTTSVNFYQLCSAVVESNLNRKTIITDAANFPTDRYILEGIADTFGLTLQLIDNENVDGKEYERITPEILEPYLNDDVALVTFQVLQYRSGALNPIREITALAKKYGVLTVWDASHAAGSAGSISVSGQVTSGTTTSGVSVSSGTTADGNAGTVGANCSGDNCRISGRSGGNSGAGSGGGSGGSSSGAGTAGSNGGTGGGGGGGAAQVNAGRTAGGSGGSGSISYQFVRIV